MRNEVTGNTLWFEVAKSAYGVALTVHREPPALEGAAHSSPPMAMATVHVDFFGGMGLGAAEQIKVQLWDERAGEEPGWDIPAGYGPHARDASIVLVADVRQWRPPHDA